MKTIFLTSFIVIAISSQAQSIVGKWQLSEQKTCFQAEMKESETEKELTAAMGATSATGVGRVMTLEEKGSGEEGIAEAGKKKISDRKSFKYQLSGSEFQILDKKSGLVTSRWIIDELTDTSLKMHDAARECETKSYIKVK
jgi:hypothetical protein